MVFPYMVPVYGFLVKAGSREIENLTEQYQLPVAEYLAEQVETEK